MNVVVVKIIMIGIPIFVAVCGVAFIVYSVIRGKKNAKKAANSVCGLKFIHPDNGGGHELILYNTEMKAPSLRPFSYSPGFLSPEVPFYFWHEQKDGDSYKIVPYDVDAVEKEAPIITGFDIFDINDWDCHKQFRRVKSRFGEAVKTGSWAVMAVACLIISFVIVSDKEGQNNQVVNPPAQQQQMEATR